MNKATVSRTLSPTPGYHGGYLRVDLTRGQSERIALDDAVLRRFLGGCGLGVKLLLDERAATLAPLSPEARLAFVFSPLVGSPLTTSSKFAVVGKSPLTDRINDSLAGGHFALAGKRTGCDAIVLVGRAPVLSVLVIDEGQVRLEPADDLAGATCSQTESRLRQRLGADCEVATIGPAGERLVRFATISHRGRHAARGGHGAVLGAKNLKAVAVRGSRQCHWAHPGELAELARDLAERSVGPATAKYRELGTTENLLLFNRLGTLPTRNFQHGSFAGAANLAPDARARAQASRPSGCAACMIGCEHFYQLDGDPGKHEAVRLEYEVLFAFGPLCAVDDRRAVLRAVERCNELGLDAISTGGTIAFAMECVERKLLDADWLRFGDGAAVLRAIDEIARREGVGGLMAEGSRRMALALGGDSLSFAAQVKGLELPGYEPRGLQTMALGFAVGTRGADHNRSAAYEADFSDQVDRRHAGPEAAALAVASEDRAAILDSLVLCKFLRGALVDFFGEASRMLHLVTGWDTSAEELRTIARRIVTAKKHFNILAGWQPEEDTLPARFLKEPLAGDPAAAMTGEQLAGLVRAYNLARGWTPEGWIPAELVEELG
ncbi:MAG: aldehyde ferredoxin oxidoreductase family protein [Pirellulales bacterium]